MCGIVGYVGAQDATPILLDCLKRLEYRGYDSAGLSVIQDGRLEVRRSVGKNSELARRVAAQPLNGRLGIAHTRWATHGRPADHNAHPHTDCSNTIAVVHNGIIENFQSLRSELEAQGHRFGSQTDTEVVAHLLERAANDDMETAVRRTMGALRGSICTP
jgi:glucosamine--fructose-6-phosphate aminotransferase (isomerizing)